MRLAFASLLLLLAACNRPAVDGGSQVPDGPDERVLIAPPLVTCDPAAPWPARVRVVSWNIAAARVGSLDDIARVLASIDADVVLLQEVDVGVRRTGGQNEAEGLAEQLHAAYAFGEAIPWDGGHYGLATISRLPFVAVKRISLDDPAASERRIGLDTTLCFGPSAIRVVNVHADLVSQAGAANVIDLVKAVSGSVGQGLLLGGDFNAQPGDPGPQAAVRAGLQDLVVASDTAPTWSDRRLDFVFGDARIAPRVTSAAVVVSDKSDHRPVVVNLAGQF